MSKPPVIDANYLTNVISLIESKESKKRPLLACAIMVKNEAPRIVKTMSSLVGYAGIFVIMDTGSEDDTVQVVKDYCKKKRLRLHLFEEPFIDFATSRNRLLQECQGKSDFIITLDANEEAKNPVFLPLYLDHVKKDKESEHSSIFSVRFHLENDMGRQGSSMHFTRISLIRNNLWDEIYYEMPVHERIACKRCDKCEMHKRCDECKARKKHVNDCTLLNTPFHLYQDRAQDKKSDTRYPNDIIELEKYGKEHGYGVRVLHYLCQTSINMKNYEALHDYAERLIKFDDGEKYIEFVFFAYMHLGTSKRKLGKKGWLESYLQAHKYSKRRFERCEPMYTLCVHYYAEKDKVKALKYARKACKVPLPDKKDSLLDCQIDYNVYNKMRWLVRDHLEYEMDLRPLPPDKKLTKLTVQD